MSKEIVLMTAKMYKCQSAAQSLFGEEYENKLKWYVDTLRAVMAKESLDVLKAVLFVSNLDSVKDNGMALMLFIAAGVEMTEGFAKPPFNQHPKQ